MIPNIAFVYLQFDATGVAADEAGTVSSAPHLVGLAVAPAAASTPAASTSLARIKEQVYFI